MKITRKVLNRYVKRMSMLSAEAARQISNYLSTHAIEDGYSVSALMAFSYAVATKYGEGAAALAAEMYDAIAELSDAYVPPAVPAKTATYSETASAVQGARLFSKDPEVTASAVSRLVKQAGEDTTMQNAMRDGAEAAWIPSGDTCAFCLTLASRGWQTVSKRSLRRGIHADHIHNNCDCVHMVRFDSYGDGTYIYEGSQTEVEGYDPEAYYEMYKSQPGTPKQKINAMRREAYAENKEAINAQKRSAYAKRIELNSSAAEEINVD